MTKEKRTIDISVFTDILQKGWNEDVVGYIAEMEAQQWEVDEAQAKKKMTMAERDKRRPRGFTV